MSNLMSEEEFEEYNDQYEEVMYILTHADGYPYNPDVPAATSIDLSDAVNTASQLPPEGLGIRIGHGIPEYPYVGDFKQPGVKE